MHASPPSPHPAAPDPADVADVAPVVELLIRAARRGDLLVGARLAAAADARTRRLYERSEAAASAP